MENCIFCQIVKGEAPSHKIWEDEKHLAFLSIFPNTEGVTVVVTKEHQPSYVLTLPDGIKLGLFKAASTVAQLLDAKLDDVSRTGLIAEGFGVDHAHLKLFPMHGTKAETWQPIHSHVDKYFDRYEGYLSSHDYKRADDAALEQLAKKIRE